MSAVVFLPLTQGQVAIIDFDDFELVRESSWHALRSRHGFYAVQTYRTLAIGVIGTLYLHRFLLGLEPGDARQGDHISGNRLDNRRENLRIVTRQQNARAFRRKSEGMSSSFRGVYWNKVRQKWHALVDTDGKKTYLGYFNSEEDAARAYDAAAIKLFGCYAQPNFKQ